MNVLYKLSNADVVPLAIPKNTIFAIILSIAAEPINMSMQIPTVTCMIFFLPNTSINIDKIT
jgi:hypothetical protein